MIRRFFFLAVITLTWTISHSLQYTNIVQTTYGPLRGEEITSRGLKYKAFKGIPYAQPPVGELRFRAPLPPKKWTTVRDATKYGPICLQPGVTYFLRQFGRLKMSLADILKFFLSNAQNLLEAFSRMLRDSEDCLSLNVYTTQIGGQPLKPVLVFLHGGAYFLGDGTDVVYGPDYLIERDIVVITLNYRIGALGFLATNTSDATGNWGLKDQVAALRWIQDNIAQFGGDPKQVTIYGESAGSASVHYHVVSPVSRGLFQKVIGSSGAVTCPWAVGKEPEHMSRALARETGASPDEIDDPEKRVRYLRKVKGKILAERILEVVEAERHPYAIESEIPFGPVVEPPGTKDAFITEDPATLLAEGKFTKVPIMLGNNDLEGGVLFMGFSNFKTPYDLRKIDIDICRILPSDLRTAIMARNECPKVNQLFSNTYFGGKRTSSSPLQLTYMFGDMLLAHGVHVAKKWHAQYAKKDSPAYFYYFTYDGEWNLLKNLFRLKLPGVAHGDDLNYVFKSKIAKLPPLAPTSPGQRTLDRMLGFITNFVKYGNPTPTTSDLVPFKWVPAYGNELNTLHIDVDLKMEKDILKPRMDLWDSLYLEYVGNSVYR